MPRSSSAKKSSRDKVRAHRARLRRQGLRPVQLWLPNTHSPSFRKEAARQSRRVAASPGEKDVMDFIESITNWAED